MRRRGFTSGTQLDGQALDHVWIHSARWLDLAERDGLRVLVRGEGSTVWDAQGKAYLDGFAGLAVVNVGHGRREIAEAIAEQTVRLAYYPTTRQFANRPAAELGGQARHPRSRRSHPSHVCGERHGGGRAALQIAPGSRGKRGRKPDKVISLQGGYHGGTIGRGQRVPVAQQGVVRAAPVRPRPRPPPDPFRSIAGLTTSAG